MAYNQTMNKINKILESKYNISNNNPRDLHQKQNPLDCQPLTVKGYGASTQKPAALQNRSDKIEETEHEKALKEYVKKYLLEIEKKFNASETNANFKFPRDEVISSDSSLASLTDITTYHLPSQNLTKSFLNPVLKQEHGQVKSNQNSNTQNESNHHQNFKVKKYNYDERELQIGEKTIAKESSPSSTSFHYSSFLKPSYKNNPPKAEQSNINIYKNFEFYDQDNMTLKTSIQNKNSLKIKDKKVLSPSTLKAQQIYHPSNHQKGQNKLRNSTKIIDFSEKSSTNMKFFNKSQNMLRSNGSNLKQRETVDYNIDLLSQNLTFDEKLAAYKTMNNSIKELKINPTKNMQQKLVNNYMATHYPEYEKYKKTLPKQVVPPQKNDLPVFSNPVKKFYITKNYIQRDNNESYQVSGQNLGIGAKGNGNKIITQKQMNKILSVDKINHSTDYYGYDGNTSKNSLKNFPHQINNVQRIDHQVISPTYNHAIEILNLQSKNDSRFASNRVSPSSKFIDHKLISQSTKHQNIKPINFILGNRPMAEVKQKLINKNAYQLKLNVVNQINIENIKITKQTLF